MSLNYLLNNISENFDEEKGHQHFNRTTDHNDLVHNELNEKLG